MGVSRKNEMVAQSENASRVAINLQEYVEQKKRNSDKHHHLI